MLKLTSLMLYWHTLRHLKPIQFYARVQFYLFGRFGSRQFLSIENPPLRISEILWQAPIETEISLVGPRTFRLLNTEHELLSEGGWNNPRLEKILLYNLHYFGDLTAKNALLRSDWHESLILDWIANNPPTLGNGWEPYPVSLRIVNWIKWSFARRISTKVEHPNSFVESLASQIRWLSKRLEWHLLGNHLFANAKALVFSGIYFQGREADSWLKQGLKIINRELDEQVLKDGGNFERSPMYHAIFLEDLLDLINIVQSYPSAIDLKLVNHWQIVANKMLNWLRVMSHPDGQIALFNDAAFGIAPNIIDLQNYALRLGLDISGSENSDALVDSHAIEHLKDSGYIQLITKHAVAFLDVARIGPDYLPGHAHADTLSFELSVFGQRVIVNGGTSRYGIGVERLRERQTVSHSTVEVDGLSSSEVWGGFRVARRAYPFDLDINDDSNQVLVSCSHDGYKRLPGKPIHRRTWKLLEDELEIYDVIQGSYSDAVARFIIHPDILVSQEEYGLLKLTLPQGNLINFVIRNGSVRIETAFYAPEFGKVIETKCIVVRLEKSISSIQIRWN